MIEASVKESAKGLPEPDCGVDDPYGFENKLDGLISLVQGRACPKEYPRLHSISNLICCKTTKFCKKGCGTNISKYCVKGQSYA